MLDTRLDSLSTFDARVDAVRRFNRFYTRRLGLLRKSYLDSPFSLAQMRVLYEIAHRDRPTASEIARALDLDPGYLSRMLADFVGRGLIAKSPSREDARQSHLALTAHGTDIFVPLEQRSQQEIGALLAALPTVDQARTVAAMATIESLLAPADAAASYLLRPHRPGDMGWVVGRHGSFYAEAYGWDMSFEALVAEIVAAFLKGFDARREYCWIAEMDGAPVGSVFLVCQSDEVAKLRLLLVDPQARGRGIGERLIAECIGFARRAGYRRATLWTQSILVTARHLYERAGFARVAVAPHTSFGHDLVGETWELAL